MAWMDYTQVSNDGTLIGSSVAAAGPVTSTTSADLVSAASNTTGIVITSVSLNVICEGSNSAFMDFKINGNIVLSTMALASVSQRSDGSLGGLCAIKVPSGQAISYTYTHATNGQGYVRISYRAL